MSSTQFEALVNDKPAWEPLGDAVAKVMMSLAEKVRAS